MNFDLGLIFLLLILVVSSLHFVVQLLGRNRHALQRELKSLADHFSRQESGLSTLIRQESVHNRVEQSRVAKESREEIDTALVRFGERQLRVFDSINSRVEFTLKNQEERSVLLEHKLSESLEKIWANVDKRLQSMQSDNAQQLEKMRETVDEKLHQTLEDRLGHSFKMVSDHLEKVQKGLGEMQHLAAGVGDLKKVLANVKTRGVMGEMQLIKIIEQVMTVEQYELNASPVPGRDTRVEVAIKLPGKQTQADSLYLPIDAKFPMDRYQQLSDAYEDGCPEKIKSCSKDLQRAMLASAKDIQTKYIAPPHTTDFAIMFLPVEGLYAEVSRQPDLLYRLKSEHQVIVAGPNNLSAFLSSLQMGFRTLAIEKRSSEVWSLLSEIKSEFGKFGTALDKVQKKLSEANNVIDQAGVRRRAVERRLSKVEELPKGEQLSGHLDKVL
ncbi:MAG: DNA recombination protein RmuC [Saprospiraceae bacterium]|nr:DNA recombination protein RmuC [Saprospiraceae bacterium]